MASQNIELWQSIGELAPQQVLQRIVERIEEYEGISSEEDSALQDAYRQHNTKSLNKEAFALLFHGKANISARTEAAHIIFDMISYLSTVPFVCKPSHSAPDLPKDLSLAQLKRGLVWLLPGRYTTICPGGSLSRTRTPADRRRLLFQSLATATVAPDDSTSVAALRTRAERNAHEIPLEMSRQFAGVNNDEDGDEIFHDLLDVLYATQPRPNPCLVPVRRDEFREVAKKLQGEKEKVSLGSLAIPRERFAYLVGYLVLLRHWYDHEGREAQGLVDSSHFQDEVESLVNEFCGGKEEDSITWPVFDDGLRIHKPDLFDPLYRHISHTLFAQDEWVQPCDM